MNNHGSLGPICVLKVNLQNCKSCSLKVQKKLKQINGVKSIQIEREEGVVTVRGVAEASEVIKAIAEVGKKAELVKFEMQPKHEAETQRKCSSKGKHIIMNNNVNQDGNLRCNGYGYGYAMHIPPPPPPGVSRHYSNGAHSHRYYYVPLPRHQPPPPHPNATSLVHTFNDFNPHACIIL